MGRAQMLNTIARPHFVFTCLLMGSSGLFAIGLQATASRCQEAQNKEYVWLDHRPTHTLYSLRRALLCSIYESPQWYSGDVMTCAVVTLEILPTYLPACLPT